MKICYIRFVVLLFAQCIHATNNEEPKDLGQWLKMYPSSEIFFTLKPNKELKDTELTIRYKFYGSDAFHHGRGALDKEYRSYTDYQTQGFVQDVRDRLKSIRKKDEGEQQKNPPIILIEGDITPDDARFARHLKIKHGVEPIIISLPEEDPLDRQIRSYQQNPELLQNSKELEQLLRKGGLRSLIERLAHTMDKIIRTERQEDVEWLLKSLEKLSMKLSNKQEASSRELRAYYTEVVKPQLEEPLENNPNDPHVDQLMQKMSFWKRQIQKARHIPAPINHDAILATIPRTLIPLATATTLLFIRGDIPLERGVAYILVGFGFSVGFGLVSQSVLNYINYWSDFTKDLFQPSIRTLENWVYKQRRLFHSNLPETMSSVLSAFHLTKASVLMTASGTVRVLKFLSARGDLLIAGPSLGIFCTYIARLVLGPVGETLDVLTWAGFAMIMANVYIGTVAGGPYNELITHLRAVGKISNRGAIWLSVLDTVKMEFGRVADFGYQTLYYYTQAIFAATFWSGLAAVDFVYPKSDPIRLTYNNNIAYFKAKINPFKKTPSQPEDIVSSQKPFIAGAATDATCKNLRK